jgi:sugar/nucleoside kinase (ribokinase family)
MVVGELERYGVATDFILIDPLHHTRYSIVLNYRGERTILSYSDEKTYEWPENFPETAWIYYAGLSKGFEPMHQQLLALKQEHPEVRLAVNPGSYMLKYALDALYETIAVADILILNREEAQHILELPPTSELTEVALLFGLNELGVDEIVITDGDQGAWAGSADGQWHIERYPVEVVAKTGAGDAFAAGYVAARAKGLAVPDALQWGAANGAAVVSAHGPHAGLLKEDDITQFIQKFLTIKPILL